MSKSQLEQEIAELENRLAEFKAAKPAHDTTGSHQAALLELEDELSDKRQALSRLDEKSNNQPVE